jgi:hypothetical protein
MPSQGSVPICYSRKDRWQKMEKEWMNGLMGKGMDGIGKGRTLRVGKGHDREQETLTSHHIFFT